MWPAQNFFRVAERQGMDIPHDDGKQRRAAVLNPVHIEFGLVVTSRRLNLLSASFAHEWLLGGIINGCPTCSERIYSRSAKGYNEPPRNARRTVD